VQEFPEIAGAKALFEVLVESEAVKAKRAQRRRLTQLQVSYGNALYSVRGYDAPETKEAFARARELASADRDATPRLEPEFGLWAGGFVRGEVASMRAHAAAFLRVIEARPDSPDAFVAHRVAGCTCWMAGEYLQARAHLESALALFERGGDYDQAFRFGRDPGVATMTYLAFVTWALGEVDRSKSLIARMQARIAGLDHLRTRLFGTLHAALFDLMRGDPANAAANAFEFDRLRREHDLDSNSGFSEFLRASSSSALDRGLVGMRRGVELLRAQNEIQFDGLLTIALANAESRAGDLDRALALLDEALAAVMRTGCRAFEAELHRGRGDILMMRDPSGAEAAFIAAVAIAQHQKARSFELRAALSLAKLYRSAGREPDAHAVLGPALEGFAPTPEFPEIEEGVDFMAAIKAAGAKL
jgi:tetratricopeptide (TPR) repeat protein